MERSISFWQVGLLEIPAYQLLTKSRRIKSSSPSTALLNLRASGKITGRLYSVRLSRAAFSSSHVSLSCHATGLPCIVRSCEWCTPWLVVATRNDRPRIVASEPATRACGIQRRPGSQSVKRAQATKATREASRACVRSRPIVRATVAWSKLRA